MAKSHRKKNPQISTLQPSAPAGENLRPWPHCLATFRSPHPISPAKGCCLAYESICILTYDPSTCCTHGFCRFTILWECGSYIIKHPDQGTFRNQTPQRLCGSVLTQLLAEFQTVGAFLLQLSILPVVISKVLLGKGWESQTFFVWFCIIFTQPVSPRIGYAVSELGMLFTSVRISMSNGSKLMHLCSFCKVLRSSVSRSCRLDQVTLPPMETGTQKDILNLNKMSTSLAFTS